MNLHFISNYYLIKNKKQKEVKVIKKIPYSLILN